jgi:hypothetical protein
MRERHARERLLTTIGLAAVLIAAGRLRRRAG